MPVSIENLDDGLGNLIVGSGVLTEEEYLPAIEKHLGQDPERYQRYRYSLCDYTGVTELRMSADAVRRIASLSKKSMEVNPGAVVAIVADLDVTFGMARMWQSLLGETGWDCKVFRDRQDAEDWIRETVKTKFGVEGLTLA